jgi:hypothetical protein
VNSILYSRSLHLPGPLPPSTHLGITLQRHAVVSGLRYTLYHLGFPVPERPPIKIIQLRLYLDAEALNEHLEEHAGSTELAGALLDPRGNQAQDELSGEVAAAALFHRLRLKAFKRRRPRTPAEGVRGDEAWKAFRGGVTRWLDVLNEAFLTDTLAARSRRRRRGEEKPVEMTLPREAWRFRAGRESQLSALGSPDLFSPGWDQDRDARAEALSQIEGLASPVLDVRRGLFRERLREMLSQLREPYLAVAEMAVERGLISDPEDAFFIPFDLAGDLATPDKPGWLDEAVESNRKEYEGYLGKAGPADQLDTVNPVISGLSREKQQAWGCVLGVQ